MAMIKRIQWDEDFSRYKDAKAFEKHYMKAGIFTSLRWSKTREAFVVSVLSLIHI